MRQVKRPLILVLEDNGPQRLLIQQTLEDKGFECKAVEQWDEALDYAERKRPDLVVLDIELENQTGDGIRVAERMRNLGLQMPIVFFTIHDTPETLLSGLSKAGPQSDFIGKQELPSVSIEGRTIENATFADKFRDIKKLIAMIRARLPKGLQELDPYLRIDRNRRVVERRAGESWHEIHLQPLEYKLLEVLVDAEGGALGDWHLINQVFESAPPDLEDAEEYDLEEDDYSRRIKGRLQVYVTNLRKKLREGDHNYIKRVSDVGYRFEPRRPQ